MKPLTMKEQATLRHVCDKAGLPRTAVREYTNEQIEQLFAALASEKLAKLADKLGALMFGAEI